jgi:alpha-galactosidase
MGWNTWHHFGCHVSEALIRETADAMVASGMRDAGYAYLVIDDCWQGQRAPGGAIRADPDRFPSGVAALAAYVHAKGLRFGLYSDAGEFTCQGRPGSLGHEAQDARSYAEWGVDFLKYDWCYADGLDAEAAYRRMGEALAATGRPILFSVCEWGLFEPWRWAGALGHMWRTTGDIVDAFSQEPKGHLQFAPEDPGGGKPRLGRDPVEMNMGVLQVLDRQAGLGRFAGPGAWNDPDMLEVGNGGMSLDEQRAQFALWAVLGAPLIAGNDLRAMPPDARAILLDPEVIAIDQDPGGRGGDRVRRYGDIDIWARPLAGGAQAVALLNRGADPLSISIDPAVLGLPRTAVCVRDVSGHADRGALGERFTAEVRPHAVVLLRLAPGC